MRQSFSFFRPWLLGRAAPDPAGGRPLFYASDLILLLVFLAALADIAFRALG